MTKSFFKEFAREQEARTDQATQQKSSRTIGGASVNLADPSTSLQIDDESWFVNNEHGIGRGREAIEAKQLGQTQPMELVKNVVTDQITGAILDDEARDDDVEYTDVVESFRDLVVEMLEGPHLQDLDWDDLVAAAVSDMIDTAWAYWETVPSSNGGVPVAALKPVPPLTVAHNLTEHGAFDEPAYYQQQFNTLDTFTVGSGDPTELEREQLVSIRWPNSARSDSPYGMSPAMQVKTALEVIHNGTRHLGRYYNDNEIPRGILQLLNGNEDDVSRLKKKLEDAAGDPRKAPAIGGDGEARWVEIGGDAINLDVIEEQKWFQQLVWGAVGLNKQEIGIVEDVNRNTASEQGDVIYKRVTLPLTRAFERALNTQILPQFELYEKLDRPFTLSLQHSDPVRERHRQQHVQDLWNDDLLSWNEAKSELGHDPLDLTLTVNDQELELGKYPKSIAKEAIKAVRSGDTIELEGVSQAADEDVIQTRQGTVSKDDIEVIIDTSPEACEECQEYEGERMSLAEAEELLPVHPNCDCNYSMPGIYNS